ncbi:baseplate J/gp47 family protein, partial [Yersinia pestis]
MLQITDTGIIIDELTDIHRRLTDGFRQIYGDDINVDADTPDGQMIGLFSQEIANLNQMLAFIVQMLDPYQATGTWLEQRAMYAGIVRRGAEYSRLHDVVVTGRAGASIPFGTVFSDETRARWVLEEAATLSSLGSARIVLRSETPGKFPLQANASLKMETVIVGVEKVVSVADATEGVEEETD